MAVVWADGFDHYGVDETKMLDGAYAEVTVGSHRCELSTTQFRTGTHGFRIIGGGASGPALRKVLSSGAVVSAGIAFGLFMPSLPTGTSRIFVEFRDANNTGQVFMTVTSTGILQVYRGSAGSGTLLGATSTPAITAAAWNHIEFFTTINDTTGVAKIRVNNVEVLALTNQDTKNTSLTETSQIAFYSGTNSLSEAQAIDAGYQFYIDDVYIYDTTGSHANAYPVGDLQAMLLTATADTAEADWTPSTGSDEFAMIDEATPNDADYISSGTATDRSDYAMTDLPAEINYVETLFSHVRALKTDAGPAQLRQFFMQGASVASGTDRAITTAATYWFDNHPTDPATSVKWTRAGVNSALLRYDRTV